MVRTLAFGTTPDGTPVRAYELACAGVTARISDFGATLLGLTAPDRAGRVADVVLGFGSLDGYLDNPACFGATIGPVANRTDAGEVPLVGTTYQLPRKRRPRAAQQPAHEPHRGPAQARLGRPPKRCRQRRGLLDHAR